MLKELFSSFAVVALFVAIWALCQEWIRSWPRRVRMIGAGVYMGATAIAAMIMGVPLSNGAIFDLRAVAVGLAGLFAGPIAALIAGIMAAAYRLWLGGVGTYAGLVSIALGALAGWGSFLARRRLGHWRPALILFCGALTLLPILTYLMLPRQVQMAAGWAVVPLMLFNLIASTLSAVGIEISRRRGWLAHLLKAAIRQAPDFIYVKDRQSRIVIANLGVARIAGSQRAEDLVGKTDFDLTSAERARRLYEDEQAILRNGQQLSDVEETIVSNGSSRTFLTTKSPIRNLDGSIAGLVGFTKDLTDRVLLERQLLETQSELDTILTGMSDGLARFDRENRLVFSNANYQNLFPLTGHARQPGVLLGDILDTVISTGEQRLEGMDPDTWKQTVLDRTLAGGDEQVRMADGRWLLIRSQPLDVGGTVVIVSDMTTLKQAEEQLTRVAEQFRTLASTDALTGLHNRRDFDEAWNREFIQARIGGRELSILVADIDHFKKYNDTYGHPAGDACLRQVAKCIHQSSQRADDMAARYGGEEFAVILPRTDATGVAAIASRILWSVERLAIPHRESPTGNVSISIGMATLGTGEFETAEAMLAAADSALYKAKQAGRGRVTAAAG